VCLIKFELFVIHRFDKWRSLAIQFLGRVNVHLRFHRIQDSGDGPDNIKLDDSPPSIPLFFPGRFREPHAEIYIDISAHSFADTRDGALLSVVDFPAMRHIALTYLPA
jgi:hypothetical protein